MFKDNGKMRISTPKSDLKKKLQVGGSSRVVDKVVAIVIDGCALLWSVHWPEKSTAKDLDPTLLLISSFVFEHGSRYWSSVH